MARLAEAPQRDTPPPPCGGRGRGWGLRPIVRRPWCRDGRAPPSRLRKGAGGLGSLRYASAYVTLTITVTLVSPGWICVGGGAAAPEAGAAAATGTSRGAAGVTDWSLTVITMPSVAPPDCARALAFACAF